MHLVNSTRPNPYHWSLLTCGNWKRQKKKSIIMHKKCSRKEKKRWEKERERKREKWGVLERREIYVPVGFLSIFFPHRLSPNMFNIWKFIIIKPQKSNSKACLKNIKSNSMRQLSHADCLSKKNKTKLLHAD